MSETETYFDCDTTFIDTGTFKFAYLVDRPDKLYVHVDKHFDPDFSEFMHEDSVVIMDEETEDMYIDLDVVDGVRVPCRHRKNKNGCCEKDIAHTMQFYKSLILKFLEN